MNRKRMHLGMSIRGLGYHPAAWRHPAVPADGTLRFDRHPHSAQAAERGMCDPVFFADGIGIRERDMPRGSLARSGYEIACFAQSTKAGPCARTSASSDPLTAAARKA
jgi:hypothetical protein